MTKEERKIFWEAWDILNSIRARDGAPIGIQWGPNGPIQTKMVDEDYFHNLVIRMEQTLGEFAKPWPPKE